MSSDDAATDLGSIAAETELAGRVTGAVPPGFDAPLDTNDAQLIGCDAQQIADTHSYIFSPYSQH